MIESLRRNAVYLTMAVVGLGAFLYPFWVPASHHLSDQAHSGDAPLIAALVGLIAVAAVMLEVRRGSMTGTSVAVLGVLSAMAGMLKLLDLPGGGNGIFFLVILAGAAFGPRFGFLLGFTGFIVGAIITGGIGPWLPFQMLALGWLGAGAGLIGMATSRLPDRVEVATLAAFGWIGGFAFGAVMNLWSWPWYRDTGPISWHPGLSFHQTLTHYWSFYVSTSLAWDAAGATANAIAVALLARPVLRSLRRFAHRLDPVVELTPLTPIAA